MRKSGIILLLILLIFSFYSFKKESLRDIYTRPAAQWPKPLIDKSVQWAELSTLPQSPMDHLKDSLKNKIELGKVLFFDTRLSSSNNISCASCHLPELNWTDGKEKSTGHGGDLTKRNAPTIANSWVYHKLFWDGRANSLQDQAFSPIVSESEMNSEMPELMMKLRAIKGYRELFRKAYGDEKINPDRMTEAIAVFEQTITSTKSRFDKFLEGDRMALTNKELKGLHLFRTKAGCMNCHSGPFFTDNQFHNIGFSGTDEGYYKVTHRDEDMGKFKTPSLRDVLHTGPWMHDGSQRNLHTLIDVLCATKGEGHVSSLLKPVKLKNTEKRALISFLKAISSPTEKFQRPDLPQ